MLAEIKKRRGDKELTTDYTTNDRIAFCMMAVNLYSSFFEHHFKPGERGVGGGADCEFLPWPEDKIMQD